ncbi:unnamed protein product [Pieris brassicae]|uniref:Sodium-dependent multivitamin transporter n=1 Tax=Pieris brassicae TaxID=7116 RepID=A0A9P0TQU2_PIEBR|nr:unnamed protein product [Pieris brassicae]
MSSSLKPDEFKQNNQDNNYSLLNVIRDQEIRQHSSIQDKMVQSVFGVWDYIIMVATMVLSVLIGIYFRFSGGKQKTNEEYLLADRNMSIFPVAVSLVASFMSAITLMGVSAENYYHVFFGLQKTSTYEYLELRFGPNIRMLTSLTYTLQMILYNGIVLYAPAIALEAVTGLDRLISILVVGLACTFYSSLGGMKAVLFTDLLQMFLMFAAVTTIPIFAAIQMGGFGNIFSIAKEGGRLDFSNISPDPTERHTIWSLGIGGFFTYLSLYAVNHTQVQRLMTVSTVEKSQKCLLWSWPVTVLLSFVTCLSGLAMYAVYKDCDPFVSKKISAIDQLMPYYVVDAMRSVPGLAGLFVAGIFSASLSTISASCNALAAVTLTDYVNRWCKIKEEYIIWLTKLAAFAYGLVFLVLAFLAQYLGGVLQAALTIFGAVGGPLFGVFTLGMFTTYATEMGTSVALISGLSMTLWTSFGGPRPSPVKLPLNVDGCTNFTAPLAMTSNTDYFYLYKLSYMWNSPLGFLWVFIVGSIISLVWRQPQPWMRAGKRHPDPKLFTPPLANWLRRKYQIKEEVQIDTGVVL